MLMIVVTCDGNIKRRKVGRVWVPRIVGSHDELGHRWVFKEFVRGWCSCVKVGNGSQAMKRNDKLGTGSGDRMRVKGAVSSRQVT